MKFNQLANIIGQDAAWLLCKACGGRAVYIPERPMFPSAAEEAVAMYRRGYDHREISWALNLRVRDIKRLLREAGEPNWAGPRPDPGRPWR
jgi:hypothetical protein